MSERRSKLFDRGVIAHNGLGDWVLQRATALILILYTVAFTGLVFFVDINGFDGWTGLFSSFWMRSLTILASVSLIYHAWVGIREIWIDYVQPIKIRVTLQILSIGWLLGCGVWIIAILLKI